MPHICVKDWVNYCVEYCPVACSAQNHYIRKTANPVCKELWAKSSCLKPNQFAPQFLHCLILHVCLSIISFICTVCPSSWYSIYNNISYLIEIQEVFYVSWYVDISFSSDYERFSSALFAYAILIVTNVVILWLSPIGCRFDPLRGDFSNHKAGTELYLGTECVSARLYIHWWFVHVDRAAISIVLQIIWRLRIVESEMLPPNFLYKLHRKCGM